MSPTQLKEKFQRFLLLQHSLQVGSVLFASALVASPAMAQAESDASLMESETEPVSEQAAESRENTTASEPVTPLVAAAEPEPPHFSQTPPPAVPEVAPVVSRTEAVALTPAPVQISDVVAEPVVVADAVDIAGPDATVPSVEAVALEPVPENVEEAGYGDSETVVDNAVPTSNVFLPVTEAVDTEVEENGDDFVAEVNAEEEFGGAISPLSQPSIPAVEAITQQESSDEIAPPTQSSISTTEASILAASENAISPPTQASATATEAEPSDEIAPPTQPSTPIAEAITQQKASDAISPPTQASIPITEAITQPEPSDAIAPSPQASIPTAEAITQPEPSDAISPPTQASIPTTEAITQPEPSDAISPSTQPSIPITQPEVSNAISPSLQTSPTPIADTATQQEISDEIAPSEQPSQPIESARLIEADDSRESEENPAFREPNVFLPVSEVVSQEGEESAIALPEQALPTSRILIPDSQVVSQIEMEEDETLTQITSESNEEQVANDGQVQNNDDVQVLSPLAEDVLIAQETPSNSEGEELGLSKIQVLRFRFAPDSSDSDNKLSIFSEEELENIRLLQEGQEEDVSEELEQLRSTLGDRTLGEIRREHFSLLQLDLLAREIKKLYDNRGYTTTSVLLNVDAPNSPSPQVVGINIAEGRVEKISTRPNPPKSDDDGAEQEENISDQNTELSERFVRYIEQRLGVRPGQLLNTARIQESAIFLGIDPLVTNFGVEVANGSGLGQYQVNVRGWEETPKVNVALGFDNAGAPSTGAPQRSLGVSYGNLYQLGDRIGASFINSEGSNSLDLSYTVPITPQDGTLGFRFNTKGSGIVESPFNDVDGDGDGPDIESNSRTFELTLRQPIYRSITPKPISSSNDLTVTEAALGVTLSARSSSTDILGIPINPTSDGRIRSRAVRLFQDFSRQNSRSALGFRSQFNLGVDAFNATTLEEIPAFGAQPDGEFFSWQGQGQLNYILDPTIRWSDEDSGSVVRNQELIVRAGVQLADRPLLSDEQFELGGVGTVRGYRQSALQTDNGVSASVEAQFAVMTVPECKGILQTLYLCDGVLQIAPFVDFGMGWSSNQRANPDRDTLASAGLGLQWRSGDLTARLDYGHRLFDEAERRTNNTWQENGLSFAISFRRSF